MESPRGQCLDLYGDAPVMTHAYCAQSHPIEYAEILREHTRSMLSELLRSIDADPFPLLRCVKRREIEENGYARTLFAETMSMFRIGGYDVDAVRRAKLLKIKGDLVRAYNYANEDEGPLAVAQQQPALCEGTYAGLCAPIAPTVTAVVTAPTGPAPAVVERPCEDTTMACVPASPLSCSAVAAHGSSPVTDGPKSAVPVSSPVRTQPAVRYNKRQESPRLEPKPSPQGPRRVGQGVVKRTRPSVLDLGAVAPVATARGGAHSPLGSAVARAIASVQRSVTSLGVVTRPPVAGLGSQARIRALPSELVRAFTQRGKAWATAAPTIVITPPTPREVVAQARKPSLNVVARPPLRSMQMARAEKKAAAKGKDEFVGSPHKSSFSAHTYYV